MRAPNRSTGTKPALTFDMHVHGSHRLDFMKNPTSGFSFMNTYSSVKLNNSNFLSNLTARSLCAAPTRRNARAKKFKQS